MSNTLVTMLSMTAVIVVIVALICRKEYRDE